MMRRSTLVFLTCLIALGAPAIRSKSAVASIQPAASAAQKYPMLIAQASGGTDSRELDINSRGEAVKALQTRLQQSGYYQGAIDGLYGLDTQRAVLAFQAATDLPQTGTVDETTYGKLRTASDASVAAGNNADLDAAGNPNTLETTPTAGEPSDADGNGSVVAPEVPESEGMGKVVGFGLGISAVLASFGVGFFMANRDKRGRSESDEWGEIEPSPNPSVVPTSPDLSRPMAEGSVSQVETNSTNGHNRAANNGGSLAPVTQSLRTSGQMGGTAPLGQVDIIDGLIGDLRNPDPAQRRKAIWELGQRGNSLAMQPLVDSMVDADSKEKSLVLAALSEIGIRSLKPMSRALAIALQDDNPEVRKNAIRDLTRVYDLVVQISQMLGHATEDEDPDVRQTATWALAQLNRIRRGHDDDPNIRSFSGGGGGGGNPSGPIDLLSSEASLRRSQQGL